MRSSVERLIPVLMFGLALSCAHYEYVMVPPQIDLRQYPAVGVLQLSSATARPELAQYATQQLLQAVTQAQPGVRILQLGTVEQALGRVGKNRLDADAVRALGEKENVQAVLTGTLEVTKSTPSVNLSLGSMGVRTDVTATLNGTLYDTAQGGVMWTDSAGGQDSSGAGSAHRGGGVAFDVSGEDTAYARIVGRATHALADVFRSHEVRRRVQ